jgi:hypothetical protein
MPPRSRSLLLALASAALSCCCLGMWYTHIRTNDIMLEGEAIDFVVSWVNGSTPQQRALYVDSADPVMGVQRWRDWGELRYCLRAIDMYAPWVRRVHLLVNEDSPDTLPEWLDRSNERLSVVSTRTLFRHPETQYPTANSNAVESVMWQIPGLSRRFVYLNNDWFLRRRTHKSTFFIDDMHHWAFVSNVVMVNGAAEPLPTDGPRERAVLHSARLLDLEVGYSPRRGGDLHVPMPADRAIFGAMAERSLPAAFTDTANHKHRNETDVISTFLYPHYAIATGHALADPFGWSTVTSLNIGLSTSRWRNRAFMLLVLSLDPLVICINDDVTDNAAVPDIRRELGIFMETQMADTILIRETHFRNVVQAPSTPSCSIRFARPRRQSPFATRLALHPARESDGPVRTVRVPFRS